MPSHVVDKVLAQPRHQAQGFHIGPERVVVLRREKSLAGIVPVFLNQRDGFRKQLDTSEVVGFLSLVFQPEAALVIPEEVLPGDAYRIGIGGAGVTGEKEEVLGVMTCDLRFSGISRSRSFSKFSRLSTFGVPSFCLGSLKWQKWYFSECPSL